MQKPGVRIALVLAPTALLWLYFIGQSAGTLVSLLDTAPPAAAAAPTAAAATDALPPDEPAMPPAPTFIEPVRAPLAPLPTPGVYAADGGVATAPLEHPEITDPTTRALLKPAWDD